MYEDFEGFEGDEARNSNNFCNWWKKSVLIFWFWGKIRIFIGICIENLILITGYLWLVAIIFFFIFLDFAILSCMKVNLLFCYSSHSFIIIVVLNIENRIKLFTNITRVKTQKKKRKKIKMQNFSWAHMWKVQKAHLFNRLVINRDLTRRLDINRSTQQVSFLLI